MLCRPDRRLATVVGRIVALARRVRRCWGQCEGSLIFLDMALRVYLEVDALQITPVHCQSEAFHHGASHSLGASLLRETGRLLEAPLKFASLSLRPVLPSAATSLEGRGGGSIVPLRAFR